MSESSGMQSTRFGLGYHKPIDRPWQPVIYTVVQIEGTDYAVMEGCILLGTVEEQEGIARRFGENNHDPKIFSDAGFVLLGAAIKGAAYRWPNGKVPYTIASHLANQDRVNKAIAHWNGLGTKVQLVPRTNEPDYVDFIPGPGCSSFVGRRGGRQVITVGDGCTEGNMKHEIGHCIGLYHEQSRGDREQYVEIKWANVDPTMKHNFNQEDSLNLGPYDFGSIMHYPAAAFSVNGQPTIVPKIPLPPGVVMGQRNGLSATDVAAVKTLYA